MEAAKWKKGDPSPNPGGISKATGLSGSTMRARLREKLEADEARLERILEARIALCEPKAEVEPHVTLKAMDDLIEHIDGKLDKTITTKGEIHIKRLQLDTPPSESP